MQVIHLSMPGAIPAVIVLEHSNVSLIELLAEGDHARIFNSLVRCNDILIQDAQRRDHFVN